MAVGWKGQRIAVIPEQNLVVSMTAAVEDGSEDEFFSSLIQKVVAPSVAHASGTTSAELPVQPARRGIAEIAQRERINSMNES